MKDKLKSSEGDVMVNASASLAQDVKSMQEGIKKAGGLFYQYRPCRRNVETIYDIENIRHNVAYAQTPLNMNDPFDSMIGFSAEKVYSECISMLIDAMDIDDITKALVSTLLQQRAFGKMAELILTIKQLKQYLSQRQMAMHQKNISLADFIKANTNVLLNKLPKHLKNSVLGKSLYAFMLLISNLGDIEISEASILEILKMDEMLEKLNDAAIEIRDTKYIPEIRKFLSKITISCFSTSGWDNQLMWSHYANSYAGFCVEYDFSQLKEFVGFIYPVKYTKERPTISLKDIGIGGFSFKDGGKIIYRDADIMNIISYMLCKNTCWDYEEEWRIINIGEENTPIFINLPCIKSITLGLNMDKLCRKLIIEVCKEKNIDCYELVLNSENYGIKRQCIDLNTLPDDMDEEVAYVQLLGKQINKILESMNYHMSLVNESIHNAIFDTDAFLLSLNEVLDMLSNAYFLKRSINRAGRIAGDELINNAIPSGIATTVNLLNSSIASLSIFADTLNRNIVRLILSGKINYQDGLKATNQIRNIKELIEKIKLYDWNPEFLKNSKNTEEIISHYDLLIGEGNDPVYDAEEMREYMDKWDGQAFVDAMKLSKDKDVLEIGVGTGRLAIRIAPCCSNFTGVDISPKTVETAKSNLSKFENVTIICDDFIGADFGNARFDVIYSSLTFMHISDKLSAMKKVSELLKTGGIFVLSIDKKQDETIDFGTKIMTLYPDTPENIQMYAEATGLMVESVFETEFANVLVIKREI